MEPSHAGRQLVEELVELFHLLLLLLALFHILLVLSLGFSLIWSLVGAASKAVSCHLVEGLDGLLDPIALTSYTLASLPPHRPHHLPRGRQVG